MRPFWRQLADWIGTENGGNEGVTSDEMKGLVPAVGDELTVDRTNSKVQRRTSHKKDTGFFASVGVDLRDAVAHYVCLDESGEAAVRGQVKMTGAAGRKVFGGMPTTRIAIEAGAQSRWMSRELKALGRAVILANPRQVKLISANTRKSDPADALLLARLARVDPGLLAPVEHRSGGAVTEARDGTGRRGDRSTTDCRRPWAR